jgi:glycerol-3-phosphate dehydrogenase
MTSLRQIEANRRNALKSTGPKTELGKQQSRCNAARHGLTAETVIQFLEDERDYKAFELSVTSDFDVRTAVERELVLRLAGLLWRLRRATAIETGLFEWAEEQSSSAPAYQSATTTIAAIAELIPTLSSNNDRNAQAAQPYNAEIAARFLTLNRADEQAFERLNRYETALWRQLGQLLVTLDFLRRYPPS